MAQTVTVNITGDASRLKSALGEASGAMGGFQKQLKDFGSDAVKFGRTMSTHVTAPLAILAGLSFRELAESGKVAAQTAAAIRSTGGAANVTAAQVDNLSTALFKKSGIDDEAIKSGENLLLTFTSVRNEAGKGNDIFNQATKASLDLSVAFGKDMTDSAILVGKALQDPIKGVTALRRVGVQLSDQQKDSIQAFVSQGDVMSAQKVILQELTKEVGGSAEAYGKTMAGQVSHAKEELLNAGAAMLTVAAPAVKFLADQVLGLSNFLSDLSPAAKIAVTAFAGFVAVIGPISYIVGNVAKGVAALITGFGGLANFILTRVLPNLSAIASGAATAGLAIGALALVVGAGIGIDKLFPSSFEKDIGGAIDGGKRWGLALVENSAQIQDNGARLDQLKASLRDVKGEHVDSLNEAIKHEGAIKALNAAIAEIEGNVKSEGAASAATATEINKLANGTKALANASDDAKTAIDGLQNSVLAAQGGVVGYEQAQLNATDAQQKLTDAVNDYGLASPEATKAALDLQQANIAVSAAALKLSDDNAGLANVLKTEGVSGLEIMRRKLEDQVAAHGDASGAIGAEIGHINDLIGFIQSVPQSHHTSFDADAGNFYAVAGGVQAKFAELRAAGVSGAVFHFAKGGFVPGSGTGDSVPAMLTPGEFVVSKDMMRRTLNVSQNTGGGGGGGTVVIPVSIGSGRALAEIVVSELNRAGGPKVSSRAVR